MIVIFLQTFLFTLMAPALLYASIAGERERRSWDFLMVAPVTRAQVVVGKFAGAAYAILVTGALFLIPLIITLLTQESNLYYSSYQEFAGASIEWLLIADLVSISWGMALCAATIFISARARRAFAALGTMIAALVSVLILYPILTTILDGNMADFANFMNPFTTLGQLSSGDLSDEAILPSSAYGYRQIAFYLVMTVLFLIWTEKTVRFADTQVKFLPPSKNVRDKEPS